MPIRWRMTYDKDSASGSRDFADEDDAKLAAGEHDKLGYETRVFAVDVNIRGDTSALNEARRRWGKDGVIVKRLDGKKSVGVLNINDNVTVYGTARTWHKAFEDVDTRS